jgi:vacuolar-type H+-ATPase subunit C/Vma6
LSQATLYASVLAKIGAERSQLLSEAKLKTLAESKDLITFAAQLRETGYHSQIAKMPLPITSRKLERVFNENLIESYAKILRNSPKNAIKYLDLYLLRFEVENIKALIKATCANLSPEEKLAKVYLIPEDYLKKRLVIEEAAKAPTLRHLVNALKSTEYAFILNMGLQEYEETGSTARLDTLLDKVFYEKIYDRYEMLAKKDKPHANFYASQENDSFTLLSLLRGKNLNYDINWLRKVVPNNNFNLSKETVNALLSALDFESALKIVLESNYSKFFVKAQYPEEIIANAYRAFKRAVFQHAKTSRISENFNIGASLAFITQKEAEVHNLTALSAGLEAAIKPEEILSQLLL